MNRFFCCSENILEDKIIIQDKEQLHKARYVLRLKTKDCLVVFDEKGNEYKTEVKEISAKAMLFKIRERHQPELKEKFNLSIGCALPKKAKFGDIVDKLTQLGVNRIIPILSERVVVRLDKDKRASWLDRWQKIALNACRQCQRNSMPIIEPINDFKNVVSESRDFDLKLFPTLSGQRKGLREVLSGREPQKIIILIGPEGDFSSKELNLAVEAGFIPVSLGDLVLRVETAAVAIASMLNYALKKSNQRPEKAL